MLQTVEIEIGTDGKIHPLEPRPFKPMGRALLTILDHSATPSVEHGNAGQALVMLASTRFTNRPTADPKEVEQRIRAMRDGWGDGP